MLSIPVSAAITDLKSGRRIAGVALNAAAEEQAEELRTKTVGLGSRIILMFEPSIEFFIALMATWKCGATAICLDPTSTSHERKIISDFTGANAVLSAQGEEFRADYSEPGNTDPPALILFTSGTTGDPKGVMLSHAALDHRIKSNIAQIGKDALPRTLLTLPTHFGHGLIGNALTPLAAGGELFLHPQGLTLAQRLGSLIDEHDITFLTSVPALWHMAVRLPSPTGNSLKRVHVGSAPLEPAIAKQIEDWTGCPLINCYGMTETANWFAGGPAPFIGVPWDGEAMVKTGDGTRAMAGSGELLVKTPALMQGYLNRPDLTEQVLTADGWYRTGDHGKIDANGTITILGRIRDQINRAGTKINPAEIDAVLMRHPSITDACTFALPDPISGESVASAITATQPQPTLEDLNAHCARFLRATTIPARWFFCDNIPSNDRGKRNRNEVRKVVMKDNA